MHRSENVAFDAFSCATVPISTEGGPAKWLKNKNPSNHLCDFEPGGRRFESVRTRKNFLGLQLNYAHKSLLSILDDVFIACRQCHALCPCGRDQEAVRWIAVRLTR